MHSLLVLPQHIHSPGLAGQHGSIQQGLVAPGRRFNSPARHQAAVDANQFSARPIQERVAGNDGDFSVVAFSGPTHRYYDTWEHSENTDHTDDTQTELVERG